MFESFRAKKTEPSPRELENSSRRGFLRKAAEIGIAAAVTSIVPEVVEAAESMRNKTYTGFEKDPQSLAAVKDGLQLALQLVETELSMTGPISCMHMPLWFTYNKDEKSGLTIYIETEFKGSKTNLAPFRVSGMFGDPSQPINTTAFARHIQESFLSSPDEVREICSTK